MIESTAVSKFSWWSWKCVFSWFQCSGIVLTFSVIWSTLGTVPSWGEVLHPLHLWIGHFTVMCSVPWPLYRREAMVTFFLKKPSCFSCADRGILIMKNKKVCNKTRSPPASLLFKGQGTGHTTAKWPIWKVFTSSPFMSNYREKKSLKKLC